MEHIQLEPAKASDLECIMIIIRDAIQLRKEQGSDQWQDGYPNENTIREDLKDGHAFVLKADEEIVAYAALIPQKEPAYEALAGAWEMPFPYLVIHRVAVSQQHRGKGYAKKCFQEIEAYVKKLNIPAIRVDTHKDNAAMLHIFTHLGYMYRGEVFLGEKRRKAFEKVVI